MAEPEKLDATFFAFKKRDQRLVLTRAAIGYFIVYAVLAAIYVALSWSSFSSLISWYAQTMQAFMQQGDPPSTPPELLGLLPFAGLLGIAVLILFAAFEAACLRWLVRGESGGGVLGLGLGADTWRVLLTYLMWLVLFIVYVILIGIFYGICFAIANIGGAARIIAMLLGALAPLGFIALLIWGAVRFAPAAATSIARRRFAFFAAPAVTRGRFWELVGSFLILWIGYIVIVMVVQTIIELPAQGVMAPVMAEMMTGGGDIGALMVEAMSSPVVIATSVASAIFSAVAGIVLYIAMFGVNARAVLAADHTQPGAPT